VPVIYGFSSKAPLGPSAASTLDRYFQSGSGAEIGSGRASPKLLSLFAPSSMTVATGLGDAEPQASYRRDVCHFSDERLSHAQKLEFVHRLMGRGMAEVRMFLDHIEKYAASLGKTERESPPVSHALGEIGRDEAARARYLEFARDADQPATRARMLELARGLGWLSPEDYRLELVRMIRDRLAANAVGAAEVDLVCTLNKDGALGQELDRLPPLPARAGKVAHAAILACLGSADGHARVLQALTGPGDEDAGIAQIYLHHRPIADVNELRVVTAGITRMNGADAQVRALDVLARHQVSDRESLDALTRLFPRAKSVDVQRGIAGILIRADYQAAAKPELARALRQQRLKSPDGEDLIDVLIRRLQSP
jgi:hypothetical protein